MLELAAGVLFAGTERDLTGVIAGFGWVNSGNKCVPLLGPPSAGNYKKECLWKRFHARHHELLTPTPTGTVFIEEADATLQASVPLLLANLLVRPACLTYLVYV